MGFLEITRITQITGIANLRKKKMNSDNLQTFITHYVQTPVFVPNQFIKKLLVNKNHEKSLVNKNHEKSLDHF